MTTGWSKEWFNGKGMGDHWDSRDEGWYNKWDSGKGRGDHWDSWDEGWYNEWDSGKGDYWHSWDEGWYNEWDMGKGKPWDWWHEGWKGKDEKGKKGKGKDKKGKDDKGKGKKGKGEGADPSTYAVAGLAVEKLLGEGASGICFKGTFQTAQGPCVPVAVKPVWNDTEQRVIEILHACTPPLPNVVPVLEVNKPTPAGNVNLMPLASEGSLANIVDDLTRADLGLNAAEFLEVVAGVAEGLAALHKVGILHCDMKPDNIVLHRDETNGSTQVWLIDFGDARLVDDSSSWEWQGAGDPSVQCVADMESGYYSPATDSWGLAQCAAMLWAGKPWWLRDNPAWLQRDMPLFADFCRCLYRDHCSRPTATDIANSARLEMPNYGQADLARLITDRAAMLA